MAGMSTIVTVSGEIREVRPAPIADEHTGEIRKALRVVVLTEAGDERGGFGEVYVDPETAAPLLASTEQLLGRKVALVCRAYPVTRNYGTQERPKWGKALGLSYVSGDLASSSSSVRSVSAPA